MGYDICWKLIFVASEHTLWEPIRSGGSLTVQMKLLKWIAKRPWQCNESDVFVKVRRQGEN